MNNAMHGMENFMLRKYGLTPQPLSEGEGSYFATSILVPLL